MEGTGVDSGAAVGDPLAGQGRPGRPGRSPPVAPAAAAAAGRNMFRGMDVGSEWKARIRAFVDVAIRVPPLFVMDSLLARWNTVTPDSKGLGASGPKAAEMVEQAALEAGITAMLWFLVYATCKFNMLRLS